jgi:hypothetical protein
VGLACAQICTLWKLQIPIRVNLGLIGEQYLPQKLDAERIVPNTIGKIFNGESNSPA